MSLDEMREYCKSILPYQLAVQIRLKNAADILIGKITGVESDRLVLTTQDNGVQTLRYAWIANIKSK